MTVTCSITSLLLTLDDYLSPLPFVIFSLFSHMDSFFHDGYLQCHLTLITLNAYLYPFSFVLVSFLHLGLLLTVFCNSFNSRILYLSCLIHFFICFAYPTFIYSHDYYHFLLDMGPLRGHSLADQTINTSPIHNFLKLNGTVTVEH